MCAGCDLHRATKGGQMEELHYGGASRYRYDRSEVSEALKRNPQVTRDLWEGAWAEIWYSGDNYRGSLHLCTDSHDFTSEELGEVLDWLERAIREPIAVRFWHAPEGRECEVRFAERGGTSMAGPARGVVSWGLAFTADGEDLGWAIIEGDWDGKLVHDVPADTVATAYRSVVANSGPGSLNHGRPE